MAFDKNSYDNEYRRQNYDRVAFDLPKGKKQVIKKCAVSKGQSVSKFIVKAVEEYYNLDLSK
jgi:uncharacterized protein (DUF1778 family)